MSTNNYFGFTHGGTQYGYVENKNIFRFFQPGYKFFHHCSQYA